MLMLLFCPHLCGNYYEAEDGKLYNRDVAAHNHLRANSLFRSAQIIVSVGD